MSDKNIVPFSYKGTVFELTEEEGWRRGSYYRITDIKEHGEEVEIPAQANGKPIEDLALHQNSWYRQESDKDYIYPGVKKLIIPEGLKIDGLENTTFPDLEGILLSPKHKEFSSDGKMLFKKKDHELYLALCAGREDTVRVPKDVKKLSHKAFQNTKCREIIFENPDLQLDDSSFKNSVWLDKLQEKKEPIYVGNTLYKVFSNAPLTVKPTASRFFRDAFKEHMPMEITTHLVPPVNMMRGNRYCSNHCKVLNLTMGKKKLNWSAIASWSGLEAVHFTDHALYKDIDGVVFSKDGETLIYYPASRKASSYDVPPGTKTIGRQAFAGQEHLISLAMPDSVTQIYQGAFMQCHSLESITLSKNIAEIPDATAFQAGGVFEGCYRLTTVHLPQNLEHLGASAFAGCPALEEIELPPRLRMIGEYAFFSTGLQEIHLPASLSILGRGALLFRTKNVPVIYAYEGTARGLAGAIEAVPPGLADGTANMDWTPAVIMMQAKDGTLKDEILIPANLKRSSGVYIDIAWNQEKFDYDTYDNCFEDITVSEEKMDTVIKILKSGRDLTDTPYESYLKNMGSKITERIIASCQEDKVVDFLKYDMLSKPALKKALKTCTQKGYNTATAYILNLLDEGKIKKETAIRI